MRTFALWLGLVLYFVVGYWLAGKQTLVSPSIFGNVVFGAAALFTLGYFVQRQLAAVRRTPSETATRAAQTDEHDARSDDS